MHEEIGSMQRLVPRFLLGLSLGLTLAGVAGCHRDPGAANAEAVADNSGPDPADANMAPVDHSQTPPAPAAQGAVLGFRSQSQPQQSAEQFAAGAQEPAPQQASPPAPLPDQDQAYQDAQTAE